MDRVPLRFTEEVLLQLEMEESKRRNLKRKLQAIRTLASIWSGIANRPRKYANLKIYFDPHEVVFYLESDRKPVALEDLGSIVIDEFLISDNRPRDGLHCDPLTESSLKQLKKLLRRGNPCELSVYCRNEHPLLQQLCLAPARVTKLKCFYFPITCREEVFVRILERRTLGSFAFWRETFLTPELLRLLLAFLPTREFHHLSIAVTTDSSVSIQTLTNELIDTVLSMEGRRRCIFWAGGRNFQLCSRRFGDGVQSNVRLMYENESHYVAVCFT
uniref:F-box domain-containing protein n=1 Tax=Steinernema glaseri TaxID=37863 RepID=A0A1I7YXE0_9BILA